MDAVGRFLASPVGSALRVFAGLVLGYVILDLQKDGRVSITLDEVGTWVAAAAAIALPLIIAFLNPQDPRFGSSSSS